MSSPAVPVGGVLIGPFDDLRVEHETHALVELLRGHGLLPGHWDQQREPGTCIRVRLEADARTTWVPDHDTLGLAERLDASLGVPEGGADSDPRLDRETLVALLASPVGQVFPSVDELRSAIHMRRRVSRAAARTAMDFHTSRVARPMHLWRYDEDRGFTLLEGPTLIDALRVTTQPDVSGELYAFSCYRATEYVLLLGLAEELADSNPALLEALEAQWRHESIASGRFHDTFLREFGSNEEPLPPRYYVPGDRVWFRNPDEASSDASGYEGSWTMYLGGGLFANMWKRNQPFTLLTKCIEVYHWRHATFRDDQGDLRIDESVVASEVAATLASAEQTQAIFERMLKLRDLKGVYADGGCIDRTREALRWVRPGTSDIDLPERAAPEIRAEPVLQAAVLQSPVAQAA